MFLFIIIIFVVIFCVDMLFEVGRLEKLMFVWYLKFLEFVKNNLSDIINKKEECFRIVILLEVFCIVWFFFELFVWFLVFLLKKNFFFRFLNVIDLLVIMLYYIFFIIFIRKFGVLLYIVWVFCFFKIFRVMKRLCYVLMVKVLGKIIKVCLKDFWMMNFFILIVIVVFGSVVYYFE